MNLASRATPSWCSPPTMVPMGPKMPSVRDLIADGNHDARRLARFEDDHHGAWLGSFEVRIDEFVATAFRRLDDRDVALRSPFRDPALKLVGDGAQGGPRHRV